jgi:hypothetical protein
MKEWIAERIVEGVLVILAAYALIGQLHVAYFYLTVSRLDCNANENVRATSPPSIS